MLILTTYPVFVCPVEGTRNDVHTMDKVGEGHPACNQTDQLADKRHYLAFRVVVALVGSGSLGGLPV